MEIKTVKITDLKPHPRNPRIHPESAITKLVKSVQEFGWTNPILVSKDGYILAGHARLKAAEKAGLKEVPVIYLPLAGDKALAYMIADNKLQDETDWNYPDLKDLLQELDTGAFDIELTGFGLEEIEGLMTQFHVDYGAYAKPSQGDIDKREAELQERFKHINEDYMNEYIPLACPECGYEFSLQRRDILKEMKE